uniref:Tc1-like transposase DDE domain-containing protein n=1 Tax=Lates calcarifer TaxID=8187 RepID=A0A4W6DQP0_LATCA
TVEHTRKCRCSPSTVGYTLQKYRLPNSWEDKPRSGRPRVSSARNDCILIRMSRENRQCSTRTVCGLLDRGLSSYKAVKKPLINERQRLARCCWAQPHKNWTARNWKKILWSDESSFQLYPPPDNVRVCRRPGEALSRACTVPTVKHGGGSIMVWGCISAAGVGHLTVCDGTLNSAKYCAILETHMLPSAHALFRQGQNWMFQQDNAACHTSRASRTWLQEQCIHFLEWPAQSLDMSPIENLWWIIKRSVSKRKPKKLEELKACERLVGNMLARIRTLLCANGRTTKY